MKTQEQKNRFIILRAEGKSFNTIAKELNISKSTCSKWEAQLTEAIADKKAENLEQLYNSYYMTKEARIEKLGKTLKNITNTLEQIDLATVPAEKLLDFNLKYTQALKEEYIGTGKSYKKTIDANQLTAKDLVAAFADLLNRVRAGELTDTQASKESALLANILKAYDTVELQTKIDVLEAIIRGQE